MDQCKYVAQENVRRFRRELENGAEGKRRDMMLRLLVEEENKVGLTYEQLDEVRHQIERINQVISAQLETFTMLKVAGHSVERAERSLTNAVHLLAAHEAHRAKIEAALSGFENAQATVDRAQPREVVIDGEAVELPAPGACGE